MDYFVHTVLNHVAMMRMNRDMHVAWSACCGLSAAASSINAVLCSEGSGRDSCLFV